MANADVVKPDETKVASSDNSDNGTTETTEQKDVPAKVELTKEVEERIVRQIEYYFGDINLPRDKFLLEQIALDDGWVPITLLLTFKRLLSLCPEAELIVKAMENSGSKLVQVSQDREKLRRNPDLPIPEYNDERRKELMTRTAYAKGFPAGEKLELETLVKYFDQFGPSESVIMRTFHDRATKKTVFKGSVFVIFKDVEACKKFIELEEVKYEGEALIRKWQADYVEEKKKEREEFKNKKGKGNKRDSEEPKKAYRFPKGAILFMEGIKADTVRETIKKVITDIMEKEPAFITYDKGGKDGYVRFSDENEAVEFVKKLTDSKMTVDESEVKVRALEGEEEETFLTELSETISKARHQNHKNGKGKNRKRKGFGDGGPRTKHGRN